MNPEGCIENVKKGDAKQRTNTAGQRRKTASQIVTTGLFAAVGREDDVRSDAARDGPAYRYRRRSGRRRQRVEKRKGERQG
jgi:hypothetical protein